MKKYLILLKDKVKEGLISTKTLWKFFKMIPENLLVTIKNLARRNKKNQVAQTDQLKKV
jgi:uncharacterized spore protein YtfJ